MQFVLKYIAVNLLCLAKEKEDLSVVVADRGLVRKSLEGGREAGN